MKRPAQAKSLASSLTWVLGLGALVGATAAVAKPRNMEYPHVPGQLLVRFQPGVQKTKAASTVLRRAGVKVLRELRTGTTWVQVEGDTRDARRLERAADMLADDPSVASVEANQIVHALSTTPNDPRFSEQYGMSKIGMADAWDVSHGSRDVLVGIIDTGVDYNHPDIAPNYWHNPGESGIDAEGRDKSTNGVDDDGNGYVDDFRGWDFVNNDNDPFDDHSHGTHCSGVIGAVGDDATGVAGVNWEVSLVGLKFLDSTGSGDLANAALAIEYATKLGVTLSSNSWGGGGYSDVIAAAIQEANDHGILFVAAAGNNYSDNDAVPSYPASYDIDNIVAVAATDRNDVLADFSNTGATTVDLAAPGVDVLSSVPNAGYEQMSGTSMATPHVAGVAALIKARFPEATAAQIKSRLVSTVDPVAGLTGKVASGGRLNAFNALEDDRIAPNAVSAITVAGETPTSIGLMFPAAGDDGDAGRARRYEIRVAATPIATDADWDAATRAVATVADADERGEISATVSGLAINSTGYLAVRATDNVGNVGPVSASVPYAVQAVRELAVRSADSLDGVTVDAPWGLEASADRGGQVFSDSPDTTYGNDLNISLAVDEVPLDAAATGLVLSFSTMYDLEPNYDFAYVEISTDGGATWSQVERWTGTGAWQTKTYDLGTQTAGATSVRVRFRMTSDYSISRDGWKIDDVAIYAPLAR
jgi:subtilisin family serine protease